MTTELNQEIKPRDVNEGMSPGLLAKRANYWKSRAKQVERERDTYATQLAEALKCQEDYVAALERVVEAASDLYDSCVDIEPRSDEECEASERLQDAFVALAALDAEKGGKA